MAVRATVHDVIDEFNHASQAERGDHFERLMVDYFHLDPTLASQYDLVERWHEWSHRENTHDTGIDLVARNRTTGEWTAIQCKFYEPRHSLQKGDIDSFFTASGKSWDGVSFDNRIIVSTTDRWSRHAEDALSNQGIPVQRIGLADISESPIDWMQQSRGSLDFQLKKATKYGLRPHQKLAIEKIKQGFETHERGQWISACGTGKTFTSLKLAEQLCQDNGGHLKVLFLAPSISLVSQSLREWMAQSQTDIRPFVVCSDSKASKQAEDITTHDIPLPTTNADRLAEGLASVGRRSKGMTVVFSTYQSIDVVARAQQQSSEQFDLILCDEAHRTTGVTLPGEADESAFTRVHDNTYLPAARRLYMTATPRIYGTDVKKKADDASVLLTSMDDESVFGPEFHRLGFGEAVEQRLLTDYKVMVLVVPGESVNEALQGSLAADGELSLDDAAKIVGCWNGLAKRTTDQDFGPEPTPMKRAVAFARDIRSSKGFAQAFPEVVDALDSADVDANQLDVEVHHVDGTMNALVRAEQLAWLKAPVQEGECRVLSNARCLSEGVDVPALDAVLFLAPRNSLVDVVQSVGRVMRLAKDKDFGYVILPVAIPAGTAPEQAMRDNKRFKVVWDVLNALRSHDDRFNAMINTIDLDKSTGGKVIVDVIGSGSATDVQDGTAKKADLQLPLFALDEWRDSILARIVKNCGTREYWDRWADDVVDIHANQTARIRGLLGQGDERLTRTFDEFLDGLRANINESLGQADAIDMLSQHLITRPVFEALFRHDSFAAHNPVAQSMQAMVDALEPYGLSAETAQLEGFYASVRRRAEAVSTPVGRQSIIHQLYEDFFKKAFPKQASSLGVVYTPVEVVDFILRAADDVCRQEFGFGLTDEGVHVLDPFTGTGTFIVRLLESGIIRPEDLARKYASELWANEIMLLAYYIACVNIETTYQALMQDQLDTSWMAERAERVEAQSQLAERPRNEGDEAPEGADLLAERAERVEAPYLPFPGATLTDTFQMTEDGDRADTSLIPVNNERIERQLATPIKVIVGNPPYSAGQGSANDNNANLKYPTLDRRIADTYAARSTATNKNSLYDSYIRAFRWASDRLGDAGIMAFVSNNGWVDGNTADGLRKTLVDEFSDIYVYNLRGNQRTAGELSRQEGGKVFGSGARTGVAILIAVKRPHHDDPAKVRYFGVADCETREEKLAGVDDANLTGTAWRDLAPNSSGDWLSQRSDDFMRFSPMGEKRPQAGPARIFAVHSSGLKTNRDAWCYNSSRAELLADVSRTVDAFNRESASAAGDVGRLARDPSEISWSDALVAAAVGGQRRSLDPSAVRLGMYRPFFKQWVYFDRSMNERVYRLPDAFPVGMPNVGIYIVGAGSDKPPTALMTDAVPDLAFWGSSSGQFFPRWTFEVGGDQLPLRSLPDSDGYRRVDNITDAILKVYRDKFGPEIAKDDIFYYVYGVLHSEQYRATFAADLKRMLPRIPLAANVEDFRAFVDAGERLGKLHVDYESVEPYPLHESTHPIGVDEWDLYRVEKMRWVGKSTKSAIRYNSYITLSDIPAEAHRYMLGSRSALEWLIDRYQVKTDKSSGIVNDPNDWCREHDDPRYIVDLIKRVARVSIDTVELVGGLPSVGGQ